MAKGLLDFVSTYNKKGSVSVNRAGMVAFLASVYAEQPGVKEGVSKKDQLKAYDTLSGKYLKDTNRDRLNDVITFASSMAGSPPMTARSRLSAVRSFFGVNLIEFTDKQWGLAQGKLPKGGARTIEAEIDTATVRKVLEHGDVKMKALVTFLASSGARLNEALGIQTADIKFDGDKVAKVTIRGELTKTGNYRECYCSTEAVRYIKEWMRIRPAYMKSAATKGIGQGKHGIKGKRPAADVDHRLFPFSDHTAIFQWNTVAKKAGFDATDRTTGRKTLHLHMLRKLFRSQLALKCPRDYVEQWMGHAGYLPEYRDKHTEKQMRESYEKGSPVLHIFESADVSEIRETLEITTRDLQETRDGQQQTAHAQSLLVIENQNLKAELAAMRTDISDMQRQLDAINRQMQILQATAK